MVKPRLLTSTAAALLLFFGIVAGSAYGQAGHVLNGVGPVDQSWAGAGTAIPQDISSALHWNPAALTTFDGSHVEVSLQLMFPTGELSSAVSQGAFGPFGPAQDLQGTTPSDAGVFPIPAAAYSVRSPGSSWAFGLSAFGVGGFGVDYAQSTSNPILTPQPPNGMGFGAISSEFGLFQASASVAYQINESVSVGLAPTFNIGTLTVIPFPAATPNDANGDGFPSYPSAPVDATYGFGAQGGILVESELGWNVALSFKSRQYFSDFNFETEDELGEVSVTSFRLDYPMIVSAGVGYTLDKLTLAADLRYIDFSNTPGFDKSGFDETGAVQGFGWDTIMLGAIGLQYELVEGAQLRVGYSYNENPVKDDVAFFNVSAPAIIQHHLAAGFSVIVNPTIRLSAAAQYGLSNSIEGQWYNPAAAGAVANTSVASDLSTFTAIFGASITL